MYTCDSAAANHHMLHYPIVVGCTPPRRWIYGLGQSMTDPTGLPRKRSDIGVALLRHCPLLPETDEVWRQGIPPWHLLLTPPVKSRVLLRGNIVHV